MSHIVRLISFLCFVLVFELSATMLLMKNLCFHQLMFCVTFPQISRVGLSVMFIFFVTLSAFPAITSRVQSKNHGDRSAWTSKLLTGTHFSSCVV